MTYYLIYNTQTEELSKAQVKCLNAECINIEVSKDIYDNSDKYIYQEGEVILNPNYEEEQKQKEQERINSLYMTRSDFFDGTIKAWGVDGDELLVIIQNLLATMEIGEIEKKVAINNYKNALNFYRKHPLFEMLSDVVIPINETTAIRIQAENWDKFFDETDKGNEEAYKFLLPLQVESEEKGNTNEFV